MMDSLYDFNAPSFVNLADDGNSSKMECEGVLKEENKSVNEDCSEQHTSDEVQDEADKGVLKEENKSVNEDCGEQHTSDEVEDEADELIEDNAKIIKTPAKRLLEVSPCSRQSPRLIAISKELRRRNADRGFMPPPTKGVRRRSLSEGARPLFTKVEKKPSTRIYERPLGALTRVDEEILSDIATLKKSDTNKSTSIHDLKSSNLHYTKETISQAAKRTSKDKQAYHRTTKDAPKGPTKVHPFKFNYNAPTSETTAQPFVSLAELNMKFFTQTPPRFRTRSACVGQEKESEKVENKLTIPHTPKLVSKKRVRSNTHLTRTEIEDMELEEAQKHKFKAKPMNKNIMGAPKVPVVQKKDVTVPIPFNIIDEKKKAADISEAMIYEEMMGSAIPPSSLPHGGVLVVEKKSCTQVKPFTFEARDIAKCTRKQEKIQKELDERRKLMNFHAQPMPHFESKDQGVPAGKPLPVTKVQPFHMKSDTFRKSKLEEFDQHVKELAKEDKEKRCFHATEPVSTHREPFVPQLPRRTLDDISGFELNTAKRAEERETFNMQVKQVEGEAQALKRMREEMAEKEAEEEVKRLRKAAVHKAQPVRQYKPIEIQYGLVPLTCPESPDLHSKRNVN